MRVSLAKRMVSLFVVVVFAVSLSVTAHAQTTQAGNGAIGSVVITSTDPSNDDPYALTWGDYAASIRLAQTTDNAEYVFQTICQDAYPSSMSGSTFIETNWSVSGVTNPNSYLVIRIDIYGNEFVDQTTSDASGRFTYTCTPTKWAAFLKTFNDPAHQFPAPYDFSDRREPTFSGVTTDWCRYGGFGTTSWKYQTYLDITSSTVGYDVAIDSEWTERIVATAGSSLSYTWVGDRFALNRSGDWRDFG